jgi:hypothetical protein
MSFTSNPNSNWNQAKQHALRLKQEDGFVLTTSFTDKQPLHGWEPMHALRELWQNFRDGLQASFGDVQFSRAPNDKDCYVARVKGEVDRYVGLVDCSDPNMLIIVQQQCILTIEHLQLASSKTSEVDRGGHGEGFKLGINILLRLGYTVKYVMPRQNWEFELKSVLTPNFRNMCVRFADSEDRDELVILVAGANASRLFHPNLDIDLVEGLQPMCKSYSGAAYFQQVNSGSM